MKGFEVYYRRCQNPELCAAAASSADDGNEERHDDYYVDYGSLKDELRRFYARRRKLKHLLRSEDGVSADLLSELIDGDSSPKMSSSAAAAAAMTTAEGAGDGYLRHHDDDANDGDGDDNQHQHRYDIDEEDLPAPKIWASAARRRLSIAERREFVALLSEQISSAARCYFGVLLPEVRRLLSLASVAKKKEGGTDAEGVLGGVVGGVVGVVGGGGKNELDEAARALLEAVSFACVNAVAFRQLLVRYDAFRRTFDGSPLGDDWGKEKEEANGGGGSNNNNGGEDGRVRTASSRSWRGMFALEGAAELEEEIVAAMTATTAAMRESSTDDTQKVIGNDAAAVAVEEGGGGGGAVLLLHPLSAEELSTQLRSFEYLLDKTDNSLDRAVNRGHLVFKDRMLALGARVRQYLTFGFQTRGLVAEPQSVSMRGRHFKKELTIIAKWRTSRDFAHFSIIDDPESRRTFRQNLQEINPENVFPLFLNLLSCFLFMMNNYIIEPSSAYYAEALGSSDALSGLMIGAAPWFALTSSVVYSHWTNFNYKHPILFAGVLQFVGNLMYANAYGYRSVELCLLGRAITGLGAPRIINRRYVADATPFSLRTAASAAFAMATALGAAMGPGMAILLNRMDEFEFDLPFLKQQQFNGMTAPGYFMALSWGVYTVCIVFFFGEPTRSGLEELRRREQRSGGPRTAAAAAGGADSKRESLLDEVELAAMPSSRGENAPGRVERESSLDDGLERNDSTSADGDDFDDNGSLSLDDGTVATLSSENDDKDYRYRYCYCLRNMTRPVVICMSLIFMKRIALESIVGSTSIITKNRYGWNIENVGALHLVNGIIIIPVSIFSGYLSTLYQDRLMAVWFLAITLFGMAFLFDPTDLANHDEDGDGGGTYNEGMPMAVGPARYITGSLIAFSGIEACESYVASLMSKVVPSALAQGTFNSGLLATLVGTGGRAVGDIFITSMGLISIRNLLNLLIIPGASLVGFSIALILQNYEILAV